MPVPSPADEAAHLLEAKPHSVRAHVLMGDHHVAKDDEQNAVYYYRRALRLAEMQDLDDRDIGQARKALARLEARTRARREATLTARGLPPGKRSPRLAEALDIEADVFAEIVHGGPSGAPMLR